MKQLSYIIYWLLQWSWGIIMTFIGAIGALIMLITRHKPHTIGPNVYFIVGHFWGGVNFGPFFFCCEESSEDTKYHESGHGIQNLIWGPLMPFVIAIPSAVRYWVRTFSNRLKKSLFNLFFLLITLAITTIAAIITGACLHLHWLTIGIEILRLYFVLVSLWLTLIEIPKYNQCNCIPYDSIWFEGQATKWGTKIYKKKED